VDVFFIETPCIHRKLLGRKAMIGEKYPTRSNRGPIWHWGCWYGAFIPWCNSC